MRRRATSFQSPFEENTMIELLRVLPEKQKPDVVAAAAWSGS